MAAGILGFLGGGTAHPQIHPSIPILSAPDRRGLGLGAWQPGWGSQPRLEVVDSGLPFPSRSHCKRQVRAEGPGQEGGCHGQAGPGPEPPLPPRQHGAGPLCGGSVEAIPGHLSHVIASWNTGMCVEFFSFL